MKSIEIISIPISDQEVSKTVSSEAMFYHIGRCIDGKRQEFEISDLYRYK